LPKLPEWKKQADEYSKQAKSYREKGMEEQARDCEERAQNLYCTKDLSTLVAFFGTKDVFVRPPKSDTEKHNEAMAAHSKFKVPGSDFLTLLEVWRAFEDENFNLKYDKNKFHNWARKNYLRAGSIEEAAKIRYQLFDILSKKGIARE
jgi:hypothetical protein